MNYQLTEDDIEALEEEFRSRTFKLVPPPAAVHLPDCSCGGTTDCAHCDGTGQCQYDEHGQEPAERDYCESCLGTNICIECDGDGLCQEEQQENSVSC